MIFRQALTITIAVFIAILLQAALASRIAIGIARPDFVTATVIGLGLLTGFGRGVFAGVWGGFLFAALCGANFGSFMVSRGVAGGLVGNLPKSIQRDNIYVPIIAVIVGSIASEIVYFIMAPASPVGWWARMILTQSLYNALITLPIYWALQRALPPPRTTFAPQRR